MAEAEEEHRGPAVKGAASGALQRPPHAVYDGFLGERFAQDLHALACAREAAFAPAEVTGPEDGRALDRDARRSLALWEGWEPLQSRFAAALTAQAPALFAAAGLEAPAAPVLDMHLAAHRDGDYFRPHVDLLAAEKRRFARYDRLLTAVYYFGLEPARFSGGELVLLPPFGVGEAAALAPKRDRLVVFPAFLPHEVRAVSLPGDRFAQARFSVNCWLGRALA